MKILALGRTKDHTVILIVFFFIAFAMTTVAASFSVSYPIAKALAVSFGLVAMASAAVFFLFAGEEQ